MRVGCATTCRRCRCPSWACPKARATCAGASWRSFARSCYDLHGTTLFLDLDLVIVDSIDHFFELPGRFLIIRDDDLFRPKPLRKLNPARDRFLHSVGNSSVFRYEIGQHADILDAYLADPAAATAATRSRSSSRARSWPRIGLWPTGPRTGA